MEIKNETYRVEGMSCASCAASIESMLGSRDGIRKASVNLASEQVIIEYESGRITLQQIEKDVTDLGFRLITKELSDVELKDLESARLHQLKYKTIWAFVFSIPVVMLAMIFHHAPYANWAMMILTLPVLLWSGREFFIIAWRRLIHLSANMDTLVALGTGTAFIFSTINTLFPGILLSHGLEPHVYFESAAVIISFVLLGRYFEEKAKRKTAESIRKLMDLGVKTARVIRKGVEKEMLISKIIKGDVLVIRPGEKIPADGIIMEGYAMIDESMITGESVPVFRTTGESITGATINLNGSILMRAEKVGSETVLAQIIKLVQEAQGSKAPVQRTADKVAAVFVPSVLLIAILTFVTWSIVQPPSASPIAFITAVAVLVIACPCALGLATPTALMVGLGRAARMGILIRDAGSLETICKANILVLDKTGTVTEGKPVVKDLAWNVPADREQPLLSQKDIIKAVCALEQRSEHVYAQALVNYFLPMHSGGTESQQSISIQSDDLRHFENKPGQGIMATYQHHSYLIGSRSLLDGCGVVLPPHLSDQEGQWHKEAYSVVYVSCDGIPVVMIALSDPVKSSSFDAIKILKGMGMQVHLLSGDNHAVTDAVARQTGIEHFAAGVTPAGKTQYIKTLQQSGHHVAMAGDGINDAPALAAADIGIAMGTGTDIAISSSPITLIRSDLTKIVTALHLSKATERTIHQNLFWAFFYNIISIPVAAGVFYPLTGFLLNPMFAGIAMAFSSVSVVANSLRLGKINVDLVKLNRTA